MSNEQLYFLLRTMLGELEATIDKARDLMPEDAPKMQWTDALARPTEGDFEAIEPLNVLWQTWHDRIELALGRDEAGVIIEDHARA